jgi:hypothetical protein
VQHVNLDDLDPFIGRPGVTAVTGWGSRWISEKIKSGGWPPPDVPATKRGERDLWRKSTVKRGLDELQARANAARATLIAAKAESSAA